MGDFVEQHDFPFEAFAAQSGMHPQRLAIYTYMHQHYRYFPQPRDFSRSHSGDYEELSFPQILQCAARNNSTDVPKGELCLPPASSEFLVWFTLRH
jgi:hypothetical protein